MDNELRRTRARHYTVRHHTLRIRHSRATFEDRYIRGYLYANHWGIVFRSWGMPGYRASRLLTQFNQL